MKKITTSEWIEKAKEIRGNKYDYSKVLYKGSNIKVCIICPEHGEFWQNPGDHIYKLANCPKCALESKIKKTLSNTIEFVKKAKLVHGDKYDYSKVLYINAKTKVCIICSEHGEFKLVPNNHLNGQGCPKCAIENNRKLHTYTSNDFINKAKIIHNNKYNYSKVEYKGHYEKVIITCPKHGDFEQSAGNHLQGCDCPKCSNEITALKNTKTLKLFIEKANIIHNNKYDYTKSIYTKALNKLIITCPIHGDFEQRPNDHLNKQGCPKCAYSYGETLIANYLILNKIKYIYNYEIDIDKSINKSGKAQIDFYLPDYDIFIEYNGIQHYEYIPYFHKDGIIDFKHLIKRDEYVQNFYKNKLIIFSYIQSDLEIINKLNEITNKYK